MFISLFTNSKTNFLEEYIWTFWDCSFCFPDTAAVFLDFSPQQFKDKDLSKLLYIWEKNFDENHSEHFDVSKANEKARVLFIASDVGVTVNLDKPLTFGGKKWRCKSVIGNTCIFILL